jgi:hypothetical protein
MGDLRTEGLMDTKFAAKAAIECQVWRRHKIKLILTPVTERSVSGNGIWEENWDGEEVRCKTAVLLSGN